MFGFSLPWSKGRSDSSSSNSSGSSRPPFPIPNVPERLVDEETLKLYQESAGEVGYSTAELLRLRIVDFFVEQSIPLYDFKGTYSWLSYMPTRKKGDHWSWRGLRKTDNESWSYSVWDEKSRADGYSLGVAFKSLIPITVLQLVAKIHTNFGDEIGFYVSERVSEGDRHFVMAKIKGMKPNENCCFIFDSWDDNKSAIVSDRDLSELSVQN